MITFQHIDNEMLIHLYKALVRPHVEYASCVWSPFKIRDIKLIEGVQRRATRLSRDLRNEPYNIRLTTLGLPTLQFRRERADMLQVFKILNGYEDIDSSRLFTLSSTGLRGHSLKLFKERSRLLLRKQTFTQCVVDSWNNLPGNVVNAPSINVLRADSILIHEEQHPSSVRHGICQPSTSNDHKCAPGLTNSNTITGGSL